MNHSVVIFSIFFIFESFIDCNFFIGKDTSGHCSKNFSFTSRIGASTTVSVECLPTQASRSDSNLGNDTYSSVGLESFAG